MLELLKRLPSQSLLLEAFRHQSQNLCLRSRTSLSLAPIQRLNLSTSSWTSFQQTAVSWGSKDKTEKPTGSKSESEDSGDHGGVHFKLSQGQHPLGNETVNKVTSSYWDNPVPHPICKETDLKTAQKTHYEPLKMYDRVALFGVKLMRTGFDIASRYKGPGGGMSKRDWLNRCLFLETVAGVPGMIAGMARHLKSLRTMQRDNGWIQTLLEEAENERMHLLIFMNLKNPNMMFRGMVIIAQGVFFNMFFLSYLISPRTCHRVVGYLEEEAVKTYICLLQDIEDGHLDDRSREAAPSIGKTYYKLGDDPVVKDVIKCIRADEANHRDHEKEVPCLQRVKATSPTAKLSSST